MKHNSALMNTAILWSKESYCKRRQVGACISRKSRPISTGFNGTLSGQPNECEDLVSFKSRKKMEKYDQNFVVDCPDCAGSGTVDVKGTPYEDDCSRCNGLGKLKDTNVTNDFTLHAEYNAIIWANKEGKSLDGATIHITLAPCKDCSKLIAANGIKHVVYKEDYKDMSGVEYLKKCNVRVTKYSE